MPYPFEHLFKRYESDEQAREEEAKLVADCDWWEDPDFSADGDALYKDSFRPPRGALPPSVVEWLRINDDEISGMDAPQTFIEGAAAGDVIQGRLGDCWFISAMSVLAINKAALHNVIVSDANASKGIYTLKFSKNGKWRYVHVDDRIPCDKAGAPLYAHGKDPNETWVMVMEKAYAKLHGCYENLISGYIDYGLRDLTGGASMKLKWADKTVKGRVRSGALYDELKAALEDGSLMGCSFAAGSGGVEHDRGAGILAGHAYGILDLQVCEADGETFKMLRCRNPWGMREWTGDWCDNDVMWEDYPSVKEALNPGDFVNDGTFWIEWADFVKQYNQVFICYNFPDEWEGRRFKGQWIPGSSVQAGGGCPKYPTFPDNPQYGFTVSEETRMVVQVTQGDNRWAKNNAKYTSAVGFVVMALTDDKKRCHKFNPRKMTGMSRTFAPMRSVAGDFTLAPGRYAIVPCTFKPQSEELWFVLETYSDKPVEHDVEGDEIPDVEEPLSDDEEDYVDPEPEEPGPTLFEAAKADKVEEEDEGLELQALHETVAELQGMMKALVGDIKGLEERVSTLEG